MNITMNVINKNGINIARDGSEPADSPRDASFFFVFRRIASHDIKRLWHKTTVVQSACILHVRHTPQLHTNIKLHTPTRTTCTKPCECQKILLASVSIDREREAKVQGTGIRTICFLPHIKPELKIIAHFRTNSDNYVICYSEGFRSAIF